MLGDLFPSVNLAMGADPCFIREIQRFQWFEELDRNNDRRDEQEPNYGGIVRIRVLRSAHEKDILLGDN